ncbi:MAG: EthD family reductase [Candidatus Binataceae bacterium]
MHLNLFTFDFQSADLEAEERNYKDHHVSLARRFPNLRFYYTGHLVRTGGKDPEHYRAAIIGYDSAEAAAIAARSEFVAPLVADSQAHLRNVASKSIDGEVIVPPALCGAGTRCFIMAAEFDFVPIDGARDLEAAEKHYRGVHVELARKLPGLRHYVIGKIVGGGAAPERHRMAVLVFDSHDALRAAYKSPEGHALTRDEHATLRNARVSRIDARCEI